MSPNRRRCTARTAVVTMQVHEGESKADKDKRKALESEQVAVEAAEAAREAAEAEVRRKAIEEEFAEEARREEEKRQRDMVGIALRVLFYLQ